MMTVFGASDVVCFGADADALMIVAGVGEGVH